VRLYTLHSRRLNQMPVLVEVESSRQCTNDYSRALPCQRFTIYTLLADAAELVPASISCRAMTDYSHQLGLQGSSLPFEVNIL
jgi:hypothetical protein